MRRFNFRLQPVLQLREQREEQALLAHSRAQQEYLKRLEELDRTSSLLEKSFAHCCTGSIQPEEELHLLLWRELLIQDRDRRREEVHRAGQKLDQCRAAALEARRERMVLQKLKERQLHAHTLMENRAEQKETDEMGLLTVMFHRE
ncbi:MAG: flagellar export protein FliJ [Thermoanaerobacteraceae bacterium]|nr:flagellar export protein FliJ [Thermoanaerobacteraceae bacterium]